MKIIVLGASGTIGREITKVLGSKGDIIRAGRNQGDMLVDYTDTESVQKMFSSIGVFDALIVAVGGDSIFKPYGELCDNDYKYGFQRKFLAPVNLVRHGTKYARDGGCFTLSSGFLSHYPNPTSVATGPFNAAVDSFVLNTAPLLPRALRLNVVSPAPVVEADRVGPGMITAEQAAAAYAESVTGKDTGKIYRVWGGLENEPLPSAI